MDRLSLDANVLFALAYGAPRLRWLIEQARQGRFRLLVSPYVCEEARRNQPDHEARQRLQELLLVTHCVPEPSLDLYPCPCLARLTGRQSVTPSPWNLAPRTHLAAARNHSRNVPVFYPLLALAR